MEEGGKGFLRDTGLGIFNGWEIGIGIFKGWEIGMRNTPGNGIKCF